MSRITMRVSVINSSIHLLVTANAYRRSDFDANGLSDNAQASQSENLQVQTRVQGRPRPHLVKLPNLQRRSGSPLQSRASRFDHSRFHMELIGPSSTTMRETPSNQGRTTIEEHYGSERTLGPTYPQRPPWTDTFDDPHQT